MRNTIQECGGPRSNVRRDFPFPLEIEYKRNYNPFLRTRRRGHWTKPHKEPTWTNRVRRYRVKIAQVSWYRNNMRTILIINIISASSNMDCSIGKNNSYSNGDVDRNFHLGIHLLFVSEVPPAPGKKDLILIHNKLLFF